MAQLDANHGSNRSGQVRPCVKFSPLKAHLVFWPILAIGTVADLWSKKALFEWLKTIPDEQFSFIDGFVRFVLRENSGAAFSMASGQRTFLITVSIVALVAVLGYFVFGNIQRKLMQIIMAMFAAGITGNLYDRMFNNGFVRDFIDVYYGDWHWPAFNVADSMLCVAVGLFMIVSLTSEASQKPARQQKQGH